MKLICVCIALNFCGKVFTQPLYKQGVVFSEIKQYPTIKNEKTFIKALKASLQIEEGSLPRLRESINYFKKIKLYGSNDEFYLIEYDYHDGSTGNFPWKEQVLFTKQGKLLGNMHDIRVDTATIFPGKLPFLFTVGATGHGNGWHSVYRIKNGKMINVYDHFLGNRPQTYNAGGENDPAELPHRFTDENKDGFNDIVFYGKLQYYKHGIDAPPVKPVVVPVKFVFLYNPQTGHFTQREDYSKKYEYIFGNTKW
jgi:hypothetical protein